MMERDFLEETPLTWEHRHQWCGQHKGKCNKAGGGRPPVEIQRERRVELVQKQRKIQVYQ